MPQLAQLRDREVGGSVSFLGVPERRVGDVGVHRVDRDHDVVVWERKARVHNGFGNFTGLSKTLDFFRGARNAEVD